MYYYFELFKQANKMKKCNFICAGLTTWDYIAQSTLEMSIGDDIPGQIDIKPGGVAVNIALAINKYLNEKSHEKIILLSATGNDNESDKLRYEISKMGIDCDYLISQAGKCDSYLAIESAGALHGAIASSEQLTKAGIAIFNPLLNGQLANLKTLYEGTLIIDGNLSSETLNYISVSQVFDSAKVVIAAASPIKAKNLLMIMRKRQCQIYLNLNEAKAMTGKQFNDSSEAAEYLFQEGAKQAIVTNGKFHVSSRCEKGLHKITPLQIELKTSTGAGDTFLAAHLVSTIFNAELCPRKHLSFADRAVRLTIGKSS